MSPPSLKRASVCASLSAAEASQIAPSLGAVMHPVREPTPSSASIVNVNLVDPLARVTVSLRILYVMPQISVRATSKIGRDKQGQDGTDAKKPATRLSDQRAPYHVSHPLRLA